MSLVRQQQRRQALHQRREIRRASNRQRIDARRPPVRGYAVTHPPGEVALPTQPGWHQVLYAADGALVARTATEAWTVPTDRALRVADGTAVRVRTSRRTAVRCLYLATDLTPPTDGAAVLSLTPLARELLLDAVATSPIDVVEQGDIALVVVLVDRLWAAPTESLRLPLPTDPRATPVAEAILADPARPLDEALATAPASRRTVERLFRAETGLPLGLWRRRSRVLAAVAHLDAGLDVTRTAAAVGYATPSAFVVAFRGEMGCTPTAFARRPT